MEQTEKSINILSLLFGISGLLLLCSLPLYVAYPIVWLPFGFVLFPFGSGFLPVCSIIGMQGLPSIFNLPTLVPVVLFMAFYGILELVISFGLFKRAEWIRITLGMVSLFIVLNAMFFWFFQSSAFTAIAPEFVPSDIFAAIAYAVFGASIVWYITRDNVKKYFQLET